jgi:glycosyltransferase involved in cell wall biosynthesis
MDSLAAPAEASNAKQDLVAVMPCYNAGPRVAETLEKTLAFVDRVILVDDGSTDACADNLEKLTAAKLVFPKNRGKGHALIAGIQHALSLPDIRAIALLDADGQHDPAELPGLYAAFISRGADLVIGARQLDRHKTPWRSRFGNQVTAWMAARLFRCPLTDTQCGYRLLSPAFARAFVRQVSGGRYETEMLMILLAINAGYGLLSVPVATIYEPGNRSSHFRKVRDSFRIYAALLRALKSRDKTGPEQEKQ